ncbi:unnamed protein product [Ectocarpus sp. 12 AP-2014]
MSFHTMSPAVVRRTAFPRTAVVPSEGTAGAAAGGGVTGIAAERQDMLGVSGVDVLQPESSEDLEKEPSPPFSPDIAALNKSGSNANNGGRTNRLRAAGAKKDRAAAATAAATTADARNRQPTRSLESVRGSLIRQEETIIFALIEREQFRCNNAIYTDRTFRVNRSDAADIYGRDGSFLEYMLCETEKLHATVRRYMSLEELAFFPMFLPEPILPPLDFPRLLAPNDVNVNDQILKRYVSEIVPMICEPGDDDQHGSSVVCDVNALQALSRRVHLGKFVAESKFQEDSKTYQDLCRAGDARGVLELLTNKAVEEKVLKRAFMKASTYGSDINDVPVSAEDAKGGDGAAKAEQNFKVNPQFIVDIYRDTVIPLTKDVEILYLFQRTGYPCPSLEGIHDM